MAFRFLVLFLVLLAPLPAAAQPLPLFANDHGVAPLFERGETRTGSASLFAPGAGFFAPFVPRGPLAERAVGQIAQLLSLIAEAEAGPLGYDAVQYGATIKPPKAPTDMTLDEIFAWIDDTPGQPHAIGRYQFIPSTLGYLVEALEVPGTARFTPALQDRLAGVLLDQAGLEAFLAGALKREAFMEALAKIWAGLPVSTGKSYYQGYAGNKAVITWERFGAEMARIFP